MHGLDLILTLTAGLVAALIGGFITQRLGLSPIVGYLLAGDRRRARTRPASSPTARWPNSWPRSASSC